MTRTIARKFLSWAIIACAIPLIHSIPTLAKEDDPLQVKWPEGWTLTELPSPTPASGHSLGGKRIRCIKNDNGKLAAAIEVTYFPRHDNGRMNLQEECASMLKTVKSGYEGKGYKVKESDTKQSKLGGLIDLEGEIFCQAGPNTLHQWVGVAASDGYFYSFSFSGLQANYDKYQSSFEECKQSLVLN